MVYKGIFYRTIRTIYLIRIWATLLTVIFIQILFSNFSEAQEQKPWWQREVLNPTENQIINSEYLEKKRELEIEWDMLKKQKEAQIYFRSLGQRTTAIDASIQELNRKINRLEYELSQIPQYLTKIPLYITRERETKIEEKPPNNIESTNKVVAGVKYTPMEIPTEKRLILFPSTKNVMVELASLLEKYNVNTDYFVKNIARFENSENFAFTSGYFEDKKSLVFTKTLFFKVNVKRISKLELVNNLVQNITEVRFFLDYNEKLGQDYLVMEYTINLNGGIPNSRIINGYLLYFEGFKKIYTFDKEEILKK